MEKKQKINDIEYDDEIKEEIKIIKKETLNFKQEIEKLNIVSIKYICRGTNGYIFFCKTINDEEYALKLVKYVIFDIYKDINNEYRSENVEISVLNYLSKNLQHIASYIKVFNTNIEEVINYSKEMIIETDKNDTDEYYKIVSIMISKWYQTDLYLFVKKNKISLTFWKIIIFQILATLTIIQKKHNNFKHNDLKLNNIFLDKIKTNNSYFIYNINNKKYKLPNIGYKIYIGDMDFVSGIIKNLKIDQFEKYKLLNITSKKNRYYDIHYLLNTINLMKSKFDLPTEIKDFINRILPNKNKTSICGRILNNKEYNIPKNIIENDILFNEFNT